MAFDLPPFDPAKISRSSVIMLLIAGTLDMITMALVILVLEWGNQAEAKTTETQQATKPMGFISQKGE